MLEGLVEPDTYHITLALFMSENLLVPFLQIVMDNDKDFIEILTCSTKLLMNKDIFFTIFHFRHFYLVSLAMVIKSQLLTTGACHRL